MKKIMKKILSIGMGCILLCLSCFSNSMTVSATEEFLSSIKSMEIFTFNEEETKELNVVEEIKEDVVEEKYDIGLSTVTGDDADIEDEESVNSSYGTNSGTWVTVDGIEGGQIQFNYDDGEIKDASSSITSADIPAEIDGVAVVSIGTHAFSHCDNLISISIPTSVTSIASYAFFSSDNLISIIVPASVASIGTHAFDGCAFETAGPIGGGYDYEFGWTESVLDNAFYGCSSLISVTIPDSIALIGSSAFYSCHSLNNVVIPESVTSIGSSAFGACSSLNSIVIPENVTSIGSSAFYYCAFETAGPIGGGYDYEFGWTENIPDNAFSGSNNLISVTIPDGIVLLGEYAFDWCKSLSSIVIPDSVITIGEYAFDYCSSLTDIIIPNSVISMGRNVFTNCSSLSSVVLSDSVTVIGMYAFSYCSSLSNIVIPDSVTSIGYYAFQYCSTLNTVVMSENLTSIDQGAFQYCSSLSSIVIPEKVASIGWYAFYECSNLSSIIIPESMTSWGRYVFDGCAIETAGPIGGGYDCEFGWTESIPYGVFWGNSSLTSLVIPEGITSFGRYAFYECSSLKYVEIPSSVTYIGIDAFQSCSSFTDVYYAGTEEEWNTIDIVYSLIFGSVTVHYNSSMPLLYLLDSLIQEDSSKHYIWVSDESLSAIEGATVMVGDVEYTTDTNGIVSVEPTGEECTVSIFAEGYREQVLVYTPEAGTYQTFYLTTDPGDGKPYVIMAAVNDDDTIVNIMTSCYYVTENDGNTVNLTVEANWNEHIEGSYVLYQEDSGTGEIIHSITSESGVFQNAFGDEFDANQTIWLKLVASDGIESSPISVNIVVNAEYEIADFGDTLTLPSAEGSVSDESVTFYYPSSYALDIAALPLKMSQSVDEETGNITQKVLIGFADEGGLLTDDALWENFTDAITKAQTNSDRVDALYAFGESGSSVLVSDGFPKFTAEAAGYLEGVYDAKGNVISASGGLVGTGTVKSTTTRQYIFYGMPVYTELTLKGELAVSGELELIEYNSFTLSPDMEIEIQPKMTLGAGLGISGVATVGAEGSAALSMKILPESEGILTAEAALVVKVALLFDYKETLATTDPITLWGDDTDSLASLAAHAESSETTTTLTLASRDYNQNTSEWSGARVASLASNSETSLTYLQSSIMPYTLPELVEVSGQKMLFFTTDDETATDGNNTRLVYSLYDETTRSWSEPETVYSQETSDLYFELYVEGDDLYVITQKVDAIISETDVEAMLEEVVTNAEIIVSKWDANTQMFESNYVTDNTTLDMYGRLAFDGDTITAVWVSNSENNIYGTAGTYTIWSSDLEEGSWTTPIALYTTESYISEIESAYCDGTLQVFFAYMTEDGVDNIYHLVDGSAQAIQGQGSNATTLNYEEGVFYWSSDGSVESYNVATGEVGSIVAGETSILSSYRLVEKEDTTAVVWLGSDEEECSALYASFLVDGVWSEAITLYTAEAFTIQYMDVSLSEDGSWDFLLNTAVTDDSEETVTSLVYLNVENKVDVTLSYAEADESQRAADGMQSISLWVENKGQETLTSLAVEVYDEEATVYYSEDVDTSIAASETGQVMIEVDLSSITSETTLYISIEASDEIQTQDNETSIVVGGVDISVSVSQDYVGEQVIFNVLVKNNQQISSNVSLQFFADDSELEEIQEVTLENVTESELSVYRFVVDVTEIEFDETGVQHYYILATADGYDYNSSNDSVYSVVYAALDNGVAVSGMVESYNPANETTIELYQEEEVKYTITIPAEEESGQVEQAFTFTGVVSGTYDMVVSKEGYTSYTISGVVVDGEDVDLTVSDNTEISTITLRCGDIDGDGSINQNDLNILWLPSYYNTTVEGNENTYADRCDLNGDGYINQDDLNIMWLPVNYNQGAIEVEW